MTTNLFLAALPSQDNVMKITQKITACEARRSPLIKVQWTHARDLHITLGFIEKVEPKDIRTIALSFMPLTQNAPFMAHVEGVRLYGNAIVCQTGPVQLFQDIHRKMLRQLEDATQKQYGFLKDKRYDPHLTIGRIKNMKAINAQHRQQFLNLIQEQFAQYGFLIQQGALLRHTPMPAVPTYEVLQQYLLRR